MHQLPVGPQGPVLSMAAHLCCVLASPGPEHGPCWLIDYTADSRLLHSLLTSLALFLEARGH